MLDGYKLADPADVMAYYRLFLNRDPESADIIEFHLSDRPSTFQLAQRFMESPEYLASKIEQGAIGIWTQQDGRAIDLDFSEDMAVRMLRHVEDIWNSYGESEPYYSVITDPTYRAANVTDELAERFYGSGVDGVANFKRILERNGLKMDPGWHVLELGCGVGRIGEHFCRECVLYYGVDISANHLLYAARRFSEKCIVNAQLMSLTEALSSDITFDVFYSMIVLQHNPPPIMYYLLDTFLKKLNPEGFAVFQLPCHLYSYRFDAHEYLEGKGKRQGMEMHALPQSYVFEVLHKHGLCPVEVCPFPVIGPIGISYVFLARKIRKSDR